MATGTQQYLAQNGRDGEHGDPGISDIRASGDGVRAKNALHGKRPQIVPLLSGEQSVRHADIDFFRACRYQLFTSGHKGCPGVEYIVNDHGAALHLSHRHVVLNSALGSTFFEANQTAGFHPRRGHHCLAARNCTLVGRNEARAIQRQRSQAFAEYRAGKEGLQGQWEQLSVLFTVQVNCPYLIEPGSPQDCSGPSRSETLSWLQLVLARVGKIREDAGDSRCAFLLERVSQQQERDHLAFRRSDAADNEAMVASDPALDGNA